MKIAKEWLRKNVYTPWALLREMDLAGGTLSYEGIEVLRRVETKGEKSVRGCIIPCPADIKRCARTQPAGVGSIEFPTKDILLPSHPTGRVHQWRKGSKDKACYNCEVVAEKDSVALWL